MIEQSQARLARFHHVNAITKLSAQAPRRMEAHGVVAQDVVAQRQDDGAGLYRRISRMTSPFKSRKVTTKGISPGNVCVAQPKHGS